MGSIRSLEPLGKSAVVKVLRLGILAVVLCAVPNADGGPATGPEVICRACRALREEAGERVCIPHPTAPMVLWVKGYACDSLAVAEGSYAPRIERSEVDGGCQLRIMQDRPDPTSTLMLRDGPSGRTLWALKIDRTKQAILTRTGQVDLRSDADLAAIISDYPYKTGQLGEDEAELDTKLATAGACHRHGDLDCARKLYLEVIYQAKAVGYPTLSFDAGVKLAQLYRDRGLLDDAKAVHRLLEALARPEYGKARMLLNWLWGLISMSEGKAPQAIDAIGRALEDAERVGDIVFMRRVLPTKVDLEIDSDLLPEASKTLAKFDQILVGAPACEKAILEGERGWNAFQLAVALDPSATVLRFGQQRVNDLFVKALAIPCDDYAAARTRILTGMAVTALAEKRYQDASSFKDQAIGTTGLGAVDDLLLSDLEGQVAFQTGHPEKALAGFKRLDEKSKQLKVLRGIFACKASVGIYESLNALRQSVPLSLESEVRSCLDPQKSALPPWEMRSHSRRAAAAGYSP